MKHDDSASTRINQELIDVGVTKYGLMKGESKHLPSIINDDEHIKGVIYGRRSGESAMFVATDRRMLYLEHRPFFRINDEIAYNVLSGVSINTQGPFAAVTVHTRLGDYTIRFVNVKCANIFTKYLEKNWLEIKSVETDAVQDTPIQPEIGQKANISKEAQVFLMSHNMATLSTIDRNGSVTGAAMYYTLGENNTIYVATKSATRKAQNIVLNPQVSLTVFDEANMQTAQIQGMAQIEHNPVQTYKRLRKLIKPHLYGKEITWPPLTKIEAGDYVLISITPTDIRYYNFKN